MAKYLSEQFVKRAVVRWLGKKGYSLHRTTRGLAEHGVDIQVCHRRYPRYFLVEVKGDANPRTVQHLDARREGAFLHVLGQIVTRMKTKAQYHFGIGLPATFESKVKGRLPWHFCKVTRLQALLVESSGKVRALTWRELKRTRNS